MLRKQTLMETRTAAWTGKSVRRDIESTSLQAPRNQGLALNDIRERPLNYVTSEREPQTTSLVRQIGAVDALQFTSCGE